MQKWSSHVGADRKANRIQHSALGIPGRLAAERAAVLAEAIMHDGGGPANRRRRRPGCIVHRGAR
eukprot:4994364-Pyramimonas_sp.AAC.1